MKKRKAKEGERIYLIKVTMSDWYGRIRGMPYRLLAVPEGFTLYNLAEAILDSFGFYFDHAFGFYDNIKSWVESTEGYELFADMAEGSEFKSVKRTEINEVFNKIKKKMLFLFDYGEEWHFIVELKGIESPKGNANYPLVVESVGKPPPQYEES
ncbi:MAG: hypothetical protein J7J87_03920 [Candidatus Diapherotrites archaeon]|nr:hypothetical protein [Candidatus Diapherotrites archaeon]